MCLLSLHQRIGERIGPRPGRGELSLKNGRRLRNVQTKPPPPSDRSHKSVKVYISALAVGGFGGAAVRPGREPSPPLTTLTARVYLKQLSFALAEAAASRDPRVLELAVALIERAALRLGGARRLSAAGVGSGEGAVAA